ncbi:MAG: UvrB/UvrC motif-containing protein [Phycisphaerae bacterium]|jgi:protein arginine kinase activator
MAGICERCKKAQATYHLTDISADGDRNERHLCERCAVEEGLVQVHKPSLSAEILQHFVSTAKSLASSHNELICPDCGMTYLEFRNQGLLGCAKDYDAFREALHPLIEREHDGADHHVGKSPRAAASTHAADQEVRRLKKQLEEAVAAEDYERAASLRDRLRELERADE